MCDPTCTFVHLFIERDKENHGNSLRFVDIFYMLFYVFFVLMVVVCFRVVKNEKLDMVYRVSDTRANENAKSKTLFA